MYEVIMKLISTDQLCRNLHKFSPNGNIYSTTEKVHIELLIKEREQKTKCSLLIINYFSKEIKVDSQAIKKIDDYFLGHPFTPLLKLGKVPTRNYVSNIKFK